MGSVDDVRERLSIEDVVGERVQLKRAGATLKGLCPFHNEKTPSFIVTPSRGTYKCFGCGQHGDIFSFVMETRHVDFREALGELAAKAGVTLDEPERDQEGNSLRARIYEMNAAAATYFQSMLAAPPGTAARAYLERRAISAATIERFALGYAPDARDGLCARLRGAGYGDEDLVAAGLAIAPDEGGPVRDRFRGRVIFPIRDAKGYILGFGGRVMGDGQPKYLNSPATEVFNKSRVLYAIEHARDPIVKAREAVLVEGYMDALRAHQEGFPNVVATLGTAVTEYHLQALARVSTRLVLALDADPAGQKAAVRAGLIALKSLTSDPRAKGRRGDERVSVYVATLPEGQDPDDAIAASPETWRRAVAEAAPLMDHYFNLVVDGLDRTQPAWRQEALDTLIPAIGDLDGVGMQQTYIERLSELTGVEARYLRGEVPGGPAPASGRRSRTFGSERAAPPLAPPAPDPVRVREEYLLGLLLSQRPVSPEVRAELAAYTPGSARLAPLFADLAHGADPAPAREDEEDEVERLVAAAREYPPVAPHELLANVRSLLARIAEERARRELLDLGRVLYEVDGETAREMNVRTMEAMALKEQQTARLYKAQAQQRTHIT